MRVASSLFFGPRCDAGRGSFVKLDLLDGGIEALEALLAKYEDDAALPDGSISTTTSGKAVAIQLVGDAIVRKRQQIAKLTSASLRGTSLARIGPGSLAACCTRLRELDVSQTLLGSWDAVAGETSSAVVRRVRP